MAATVIMVYALFTPLVRQITTESLSKMAVTTAKRRLGQLLLQGGMRPNSSAYVASVLVHNTLLILSLFAHEVAIMATTAGSFPLTPISSLYYPSTNSLHPQYQLLHYSSCFLPCAYAPDPATYHYLLLVPVPLTLVLSASAGIVLMHGT